MSADLFAEFGSFSPSNQQRDPDTNSQPAVSSSNLFAAALAPSSQQTQPQAQQWPPLQLPTSTNLGGATWGSLTGLDNLASQNAKDASETTGEDEDKWGDFEVASPVAEPAPAQPPMPSFSRAAAKSSAPVLPRTRIVRAATMDLMTNSLIDFNGVSNEPVHQVQVQPAQQNLTPKSPPPRPRNTDPNVLFDADDFDPNEVAEESGDDDFGDFETVAPRVEVLPTKVTTKAPPPTLDIFSSNWSQPAASGLASNFSVRKEPPSMLLAGLSLGNTSPYPQAPKSPSFQERNPFPELAVVTPKASEFPDELKDGKSPSPVTAWPTIEQQSVTKAKESNFEDDWASFNDVPPGKDANSANETPGWDWDVADGVKPHPKTLKQPPTAKQITPPVEAASDWSWGEDDDSTIPAPPTNPASTIPEDAPPPTNVPPPSILLSIFPSLFDLPTTALIQPTTGQPPAVKARILASPQTTTFLRAYLSLATVAARILAGRKLRWNRDRFLAQGMAISAAGGRGGMKLAGVDRAQTAREDREAADVLAAWKAHVGRLRGAVAGAGGAEKGLRVPELGGGLAVVPAGGVPAALRACVVCGLKRDERVRGVDFEVEDSFGEWWVEHWGHRACRNFWGEHEASLRSR